MIVPNTSDKQTRYILLTPLPLKTLIASFLYVDQ